MQRHLVLVGAGHCHLEILGRLQDYIKRGCRVTLISPGNFWYSGMGPGALSGMYSSQTICVDTSALVQVKGGRFIKDVVRRIDARRRVVELGSGREIFYDLLSVNAGSTVPASKIGGAEEFGWTVKPIENLVRLRQAIKERAAGGGLVRVIVAGGGAAGCEVAINIWHLLDRLNAPREIRIITPGPLLMEREGEQPARKVAEEIDRLGIIRLHGHKVARAEKHQVWLDDGSVLPCEFFVVATGVRPPALFRDSDLPTAEDGSLLVNEHLQCVAAREIFGAGDCIGLESGPPPRVGVYAVRESKVLHYNLRASLDRKPLRHFQAGKDYLLILNLADGRGLLFWKGRSWRGRWTFRLKNFLDCRFVEKYRPGRR